MSTIFLLLLLLSLAGFVVGLIRPQWLRMPSRGRAAAVCGGGAILFFVLLGIASPSVPSTAFGAAEATSARVQASPEKSANAVSATSTVSTAAVISQYTGAMQTTVMPFLQSADESIVAASNSGGAQDFVTALHDARGAQSEIAKAKAGYTALQPAPQAVAQLNVLFGKAIDSYSRAADGLVTGIQNQDANTIRDAEAYINQGDAYANQASVLMRQM